MKTFKKKWHQAGFLVYLYLDDILLLGSTKKQVNRQLAVLVQDLQESGLTINCKRSVLQASRTASHLVFEVNYSQAHFEVPPEKPKFVRKELGKLLTHSFMSPRKMAAILGATRSFLVATPFLRAFTDEMVSFVNKHQRFGWDSKFPVPQHLQEQVREVKSLMESGKEENFWERSQFGPYIQNPQIPPGLG